MSYTTTFSTVLGLLLGIGGMYYLVQWLVQRGLRKWQGRLKLIYNFAESVMASDDPPNILEQAVGIVPLLVDATHCSIWME